MVDKKAILALADGSSFEGISIGAPGTTVGEAVFSTCMTGYQEMLTDPSFAGQLLTLTYPIIGNYGVTQGDLESSGIQAFGLIVRDLCEDPSNWRADGGLVDFLTKRNIVAIAGVDTRAITRHLRDAGVMMGAISTQLSAVELMETIKNAPGYGGIDFVKRVSRSEVTIYNPRLENPEARVAVLDMGVKTNILRNLDARRCRVEVYPCDTPADVILADNPDGVLFSPGPGDPALLDYAKKTIEGVIGKKPIMGICLGHQLLGHAFGSGTFKLKFGHRGGNHPVKDLISGRVYITSQNHGYAVEPEGLKGSGMEVTQINLNDGTVEGMAHKELPIFSIQYHPEASPGPKDCGELFDKFISAMGVSDAKE